MQIKSIMLSAAVVAHAPLFAASASEEALALLQSAQRVQAGPLSFAADSIIDLPGKQNVRTKVGVQYINGSLAVRIQGAATNRNYITHTLLIHNETGCWQILNENAVRIFTNPVPKEKYLLSWALPDVDGRQISHNDATFHKQGCIAIQYACPPDKPDGTNYTLFLRKGDHFPIGMQQRDARGELLYSIGFDRLVLNPGFDKGYFEIPAQLNRVLANSPAEYAAILTNDLKPHFQEGNINTWMVQENSSARSKAVKIAIYAFVILSLGSLGVLACRIAGRRA